MPRSKRTYNYADGPAAQMRSLKSMFEAPMAKKRRLNTDSDEDSSDDIVAPRETTKIGRSLSHVARALDSMLGQAGLKGLGAWIEKKYHPAEY